MTSVLVSSWAFSPWHDEAATTAAARLRSDGASRLDVIRADLDATRPRVVPRPEIEGLIARSASLAGAATPPVTWPAVESYAAAVGTTVRRWQSAGAAWDAGYSGPAGLADPLALALLRDRGAVSSWTAHLTSSPGHLPSGRVLEATAEPGPLRTACRAVLDGDPASERLGDWVAALIAARADRVVVATDALRDHVLRMVPGALRGRLAGRMEVWSRPACAPTRAPGAGEAARDGTVTITVQVDAERRDSLDAILTAYGLLPDRERIRLRVLTTDRDAIAVALRQAGLEGAVAVAPDPGPAASAATAADGDYALVLDRPRPAGLPYALGDLPEVGDHAAYGTPVILVAPQDSPLTQAPVAHHLPDQHPTAALALFNQLAGERVSSRV